MYLTVDLASKFSAAILRDIDGQVRWQGDSAGLSAKAWCQRIARASEYAEHILVEDVPFGISSQAMVKPVLRLQGMLIGEMGEKEFYFIAPATWMKDFPGVQRAPKGLTKTESDKYRVDKAEEYAKLLGYEAPDLVGAYITSLPAGTKVLKKNTNPLLKSRTDYVSAFLMNDWLYRHVGEYKTLSGVQPPSI